MSNLRRLAALSTRRVRANAVPELTPRLPKANVFYFDRTSRGAIDLAQSARAAGALVFFEPSAESEPKHLKEALEAAHIVKVASDRLKSNEALLSARTPSLVIETMGGCGLRYSSSFSSGRRNWKTLPPYEIDAVRDSSGAGDWCTAGVISSLGCLGPAGLASAQQDVIISALELGQAMAAWTCQYNGARGGMYSCSKEGFFNFLKAVVKGKPKAEAGSAPKISKTRRTVTIWCDDCLARA